MVGAMEAGRVAAMETAMGEPAAEATGGMDARMKRGISCESAVIGGIMFAGRLTIGMAG